MKKLNRFGLVFVAIFAVLLLVACANDGNGDENGYEGVDAGPADIVDAEFTIGLSVSTLGNPFFVSLMEGVQAEAAALGLEVMVADAQDDAATQINDVEDLIAAGIDVLLINPTDSAAVVTAVEAANAAGIPVITVDRSSDGGEVASFIASDNVAGGELAAQFILDAFGEGANVVELEGIPGSSAARDRGEGFNNIAQAYLNVVTSQTANFDRAEGLTVMENILQAHSDIVAVFAHNDEMALGAIEAIAASGLDIMIIGFDGTDDALAAVAAGTLAGTVAQQPDVIGQMGVQAAWSVLNGESVEANIAAPLRLITE